MRVVIEMSWHVKEEVSRDMTGEDIKWISVEQDPRPVKPNAQRKMNYWTELFSSVQFSFPLCIEPATTHDDSATKLAVVTRSSQSGYVHCQPAKSIIGRKPATAGDGRCRGSWRQENNLRRSPTQAQPVVVGWVTVRVNHLGTEPGTHAYSSRARLLWAGWNEYLAKAGEWTSASLDTRYTSWYPWSCNVVMVPGWRNWLSQISANLREATEH